MPDRTLNIAMDSAHDDHALGEAMLETTLAGELRASPWRMIEQGSRDQVPGIAQECVGSERKYAPTSHRVKKCSAMPKLVVPVVRQWYRCRHNLKHGIGRKPSREVYRHA